MKTSPGALFTVLSLVLACATASVPAAAAPAQPLVLKFASWTPPHIPHSRAGVWIVKEMEKRSNGRVKIEYYWSNALIPTRQLMDAIEKGVADIAFINPAYQPGKLPLLSVTSLPAMSEGDMCPTSKALQELIEMPELKAELDKLNMRYLGPLTNSSYGVFTRKKQVRTLADLQGMKLRAIGNHANLLAALGGVPVSLGATEVYQAIEKGTLDGGLANPSFALGYKWEEVTKYYYPISFGGLGQFVGMNKASWDKLPADLQKRMGAVHDMACGVAHELYQGGAEELLAAAVKQGRIVVAQPTPEDTAKVQQIAKEKIWDDWADKMEKKGLPGKKVLTRWLELQGKWHGTRPF